MQIPTSRWTSERRTPRLNARRGSAGVAALFWLFALALFVLPFLRQPHLPDDTSAEDWVDWPREAVNGDELADENGPPDLPWSVDVAFFQEDFETDLAEPIEGYFEPWFEKTGLVDVRRLESGEREYSLNCIGCHGVNGDGAGPAARYLEPRPRNFRKGKFKFTSTSTGQRPRREDLLQTITRGLTGSSMPDFRLLPRERRLDLVEYVRYLAIRGEFEQLSVDFSWDEEELADLDEVAEILEDRWNDRDLQPVFPPIPDTPFDADSVARGRELFIDPGAANCAACHGETGLGDGPSAAAFRDDWGYPIVPRDLTTGVYRAGNTPQDLYRTIDTGINGTPMGSFGDALSPEQIWDLVHYVQSLAQ